MSRGAAPIQRPGRRRGRVSLVLGLAVLYLLHNDVWNWAARSPGGPHRLEWLWSLPAGFAYHVAFCVAVAVFLGLWVRRFGVAGEAVSPTAASPEDGP